MVHDDCHPNVSLSDWNVFRKEASPFCVEQVLNRTATSLPGWLLPLARGALIASPYLLHMAGYRTGSYRARGWRKRSEDSGRYLFKEVGSNCLIAFSCGKLWRIGLEVGPTGRPFALVHLFGSTPILTRTYQEATYLAEFCWLKGTPTLSWVREAPDDVRGAINFARQRGIDEMAAFPHPALEPEIA